MRTIGVLGLAAAITLAACTTGAASPSPSRAPAPSPSPSPEPSASPSPAAAADFSIAVTPPEAPPEVRMAIPGQQVSFLVVVTNEDGGREPVTISATATGATVGPILPETLGPGVVGEVWVVPDPATTETTATVAISATRDGATATETRTIPVFPMIDERAADARPHFERRAAWLASEHPELGITADTAWDPQFVSTLLVVSHYAYFSDDWELTVAWHNMIPPDDWSEIHLRKRGVDVRPSIAYRQDSVADATEPYAVEPPEVVVR
jgi:hypothetical protein